MYDHLIFIVIIVIDFLARFSENQGKISSVN